MADIRMEVVFNRLPEIVAKFPRVAASIVQDAANDFRDEAKRRAPVSSNPPAGHVHMRDRIKIQGSGVNFVVTSEAEYSGFVEYGTRYMGAQPFFHPAADIARARYLRTWQQLESLL